MGKWTVSGHPLSGAALQMERDVHRADVASPGDEPSAAIRAGQHRHGGMRRQGGWAVHRRLCGGCGCRGAFRRRQGSRHHCRNTGQGQGRIPQKRIPGRRQAAASPAAEAPSGTQKDRTSHMLHRASSLLPKKTKFVPCTNYSFRMGTHTFIIPLLSRFVNRNKRTFSGQNPKNPLSRTKKTHNLNIFGVFLSACTCAADVIG